MKTAQYLLQHSPSYDIYVLSKYAVNVLPENGVLQ